MTQEKLTFNTLKSTDRGNREFKSDVFSMLLEYKERALDVYNALNNSHYDNPDDIEIVTLDGGVSLSVRNDASFIFNSELNFYEHQSSYNPNMPLRNLIYLSNTIDSYIKETGNSLFTEKKLLIPSPHFVVFYNGARPRPEYEELKLSDAFFKVEDSPDLELRVRIYNINEGYNNKLKESSKTLYEYCAFISKVSEYTLLGFSLADSLNKAIDYCINNNVATDFFKSRKNEVIKMIELDLTYEAHIEYLKNHYRDDIRDDVKEEVRGEIRDEVIREVREEVREEVRDELLNEGLIDLINSLKPLVHSVDEMYGLVISNKLYSNVSKEKVIELYNK